MFQITTKNGPALGRSRSPTYACRGEWGAELSASGSVRVRLNADVARRFALPHTAGFVRHPDAIAICRSPTFRSAILVPLNLTYPRPTQAEPPHRAALLGDDQEIEAIVFFIGAAALSRIAS